LERLRQEMDLLTGGVTRGFLKETGAGVFPLVNVTEDIENYYIRTELPGIRAEELDLSVTGDSLSIAGERKLTAKDEKAHYHRKEREAGTFKRIISLPSRINTEKVDARSIDGILTIILPKAEEAKPKQITIKTS
jgi:HSP20 family protein